MSGRTGHNAGPNTGITTTAGFLLILFLAVVLTCLLISVFLRRARNDPFVVSSDGLIRDKTLTNLLDGVCTLETDTPKSYFSMTDVDALRQHPYAIDACFFTARDPNGIMDPDLRACTGKEDSPLFDKAAVAGFGIEPILGIDECVVRFKPKQPAKVYKGYQDRLVAYAVENTPLYKNTKVQYKSVQEVMTAVEEQTKVVNDALKAVTDGLITAQTLTQEATFKVGNLQQSKSKRDRHIIGLNEFNKAQADLKDTYDREAADAIQRYVLAQAELDKLTTALAAMQKSLEPKNQQVIEKRGTIKNLRTELNELRRKANDMQAQGDYAIRIEQERAKKCNAVGDDAVV